ncbi:MAG TPA: pyrroline-5-carboxylate reductase [Patescibacteria group bacterium]|nr:pyrroline-5-carboxylate reductase [Patescibacteria group bacterium]
MRKIGILGFGTMGSAIAERLKGHYEVCVFDKDQSKTHNLQGIDVAADICALVIWSDVLILAVKPQDFSGILAEIKPLIAEKLVISIAAGIPAASIETALGKVRVIRVMPNLPAKIGKGMICLCKGRYADDTDIVFSRELFNYMGKTLQIEESMMDAATAISGSGPGFFYALLEHMPQGQWEDFSRKVFIPAFSQAAQAVRFSAKDAGVLASATTEGSLALLKKTGLSAGQLRMQVTSKGGTTEAGLKELHGGVECLDAAVKAALARAGELSKKE